MLIAVGDMGDGEIGVRGGMAVVRDREGRVEDWAAVEMLRESLGLAVRYIFSCEELEDLDLAFLVYGLGRASRN